jgi:hypothetical protein
MDFWIIANIVVCIDVLILVILIVGNLKSIWRFMMEQTDRRIFVMDEDVIDPKLWKPLLDEINLQLEQREVAQRLIVAR